MRTGSSEGGTATGQQHASHRCAPVPQEAGQPRPRVMCGIVRLGPTCCVADQCLFKLAGSSPRRGCCRTAASCSGQRPRCWRAWGRTPRSRPALPTSPLAPAKAASRAAAAQHGPRMLSATLRKSQHVRLEGIIISHWAACQHTYQRQKCRNTILKQVQCTLVPRPAPLGALKHHTNPHKGRRPTLGGSAVTQQQAQQPSNSLAWTWGGAGRGRALSAPMGTTTARRRACSRG